MALGYGVQMNQTYVAAMAFFWYNKSHFGEAVRPDGKEEKDKS